MVVCMKKKLLAVLIAIIIVSALIGGIFLACIKGIDYLDYKTKIAELETYTIGKEEATIKKFKLNNYHYLITKLIEKDETTVNILLKDKGKTYMLDRVFNCDILDKAENMYVNKNKIYIHCIGKEREINEFELNGASIYKDLKQLNYEETPNVSGANLIIEKSTKNYIYLYSPVKKNENVEEGNKIKCSLETNKCLYNIKKKKEEKKEETKKDNKEETKEEEKK